MDKITLNWKSIWEKFNNWYEDSNNPSWEAQKSHLQNLIDEELFNKQLARN